MNNLSKPRFLISILLLSTVSSYIYIGPRIMHAMGEDHKILGILSSKNTKGIPIKSFWIQLVISIIFILRCDKNYSHLSLLQ